VAEPGVTERLPEIAPAYVAGRGAVGRAVVPRRLRSDRERLRNEQAATLARDPAIRAYASTWSLANLANVPAQDIERTTREVTIDLVEKFIRAYQSVNK